ncbi:MAG TPA: hypothetical protein VL022_04795 [Moheibacter sp.]|nr:hypothetical protein [Moheibacter sp.]
MSIKAKIFKQISEHLNQEVPELVLIDKERGQYEKENELLIPKPAVLIAFLRFEWQDVGNGVKEGKGSIQIRTGIENYAESYTGSIDQEDAIAFFELNEKIDKTLEGLSGANFTALEKIADEDDLEHSNIIVTVFEYATTIIDDSQSDASKMVQVDANPIVKYTNKKSFPKREASDDTFHIPM